MLVTRLFPGVGVRVLILVAVILGFLNSQSALAAPTGLPSGFTATVLQNHSLGTPTSVRIRPDGKIFVFDLTGTIKIFTPGSGLSATPFATVPVHVSGDRGLLGAAFDSDFANHPYLYIHYVGTDQKVRVGRFNATSTVGTNFQVLYTAPTIADYQHAGGGITVSNDGYVYFGIGDSGTPTRSQDLSNVHGKVHRIGRDGVVPSSNPYFNQGGAQNTIFAHGFRNPFRLTTDRETGNVYVGDVGYNSWEEVNRLVSGRNYGWPVQEGPCSSSCAYENPIYWYAHQFGTNNWNDASIVLGPVYRGNYYPTSYKGKMFISDYVQGFLRTYTPPNASTNFDTFSTDNGPVIDMDFGPDGKLYFITISGAALYRVDYTGGVVNQAPTAIATSSVSSGAAPLNINFSSNGSSDPEGTPLTYSWDFGDGTNSTSPNPNKTYNNNGQYTVRLTVSDGVNSVVSSALLIKVGAAPTVTIHSPLSSTLISGGETVNYIASAVDGNGSPIATSSLKATITLYHSDHTHPFLGPLNGGVGSFAVPTTGELSPDIWYRITVEATGGNGVSSSQYVEVHPRKATLNVNTNPAGLNVILDGSNHVIPPTVQGVVGMSRSVSAPSPQLFNGKQYVFSHWSDGGSQTHEFSFPTVNTTLTANYTEATSTLTYKNIAPNPSFENLTNNLPSNWSFSRWGSNTGSWQSSPDAIAGSRSALVSLTAWQNGEGSLRHEAVDVLPNTNYNVRYQYKATGQFKVVVDVTLTDNTHRYIWLGISQPSTGWKEQNWTFNSGANAKKVMITTTLTNVGSFTIDDFGILEPTLVPATTGTTTSGTTIINLGNLLSNPSFEEETNESPNDWQSTRWGTNTVVHSQNHGGAYDGEHYVRSVISTWSSGEAGWKSKVVNLSPNQSYTLSAYMILSGPAKVLAEFTLSNGQKQYIWLGNPSSSGSWQKYSKSFTTPSNITSAVFNFLLTNNGSLSLDQVELVSGTSSSSSGSGSSSGSQNTGGNGTTTATTTVTVATSTPTTTTNVNLIKNPTLTDAPQNATVPPFWYNGKYGNNTIAFLNQNSGRTDGKSIAINTTAYVDGDGKWYFEPVTVTPLQTYNYEFWYKGTTGGQILVGYTLSGGGKSYEGKGSVSAATDWTKKTFTITPPADATKVTVYHIQKSLGVTEFDDFSLSL